MGACGWHRDGGGTGEDRGLTTARFRSSTCSNITLHLAHPSFFPLAFCARPKWLSSLPWPEEEVGGRELFGTSLES